MHAHLDAFQKQFLSILKKSASRNAQHIAHLISCACSHQKSDKLKNLAMQQLFALTKNVNHGFQLTAGGLGSLVVLWKRVTGSDQ